MIFQHTYQKVLNGEKTETRRLVNEGDHLSVTTTGYTTGPGSVCIVDHREKVRWALDRPYKVQPGRTKKGVASIRFTEFSRERVQDITDEGARREGVENIETFKHLWNEVHTQEGTRWEDNPEVWILRFAVDEILHSGEGSGD